MLIKKQRLKLKENIARLLWKGLNHVTRTQANNTGENAFLKNFLKSYISVPNKTLTLFDCGAKHGLYTDVILTLLQTYNLNVDLHLFEPQKECFEILEEKYSHKKNLHLNNLAVCKKGGTADLYRSNSHDPLASLHKRNYCKISQGIVESITTTRLDKYILENAIPHIHLLKLDIEGNELNALEGLGKYLNPSFIDYIQFEYSNGNLASHTFLYDFFSLLEDQNFTICKLYPSHLIKARYKPWLENFQFSNFIAISKNISAI